MAFDFTSSDTSSHIHIAPDQGALILQFPAGMSGTTFEVQGSLDGTNFFPLYVDGIKLTVAYVASSIHCIRPSAIYGIDALRLKSSASEVLSVGARTGRVV